MTLEWMESCRFLGLAEFSRLAVDCISPWYVDRHIRRQFSSTVDSLSH